MKTRCFGRWTALLLALLLLLTACTAAKVPDDNSSTDQNGEAEESSQTQTTGESSETTDAVVSEGLILVRGGKSSYRIVFSETATSAIVGAANDLLEAFAACCNVTLGFSDDFRKNGEVDDPNACEILIGSTNRAASETVLTGLARGEYAACAVGNSLVLIGASESGTLAAVEHLIATLLASPVNELIFDAEDAFLLKLEQKLTVSFMGDSITTYEGYSNAISYNATLAGYPVWYSPSRMPVGATWWHQVVTGMDWELCVNNSYSGGRVTHPLTYQTRAANLHSASGITPDVIIVYYGINDYNNMVSLAEFTSAYEQMLKKMVETYPDARIYCCTLNPIICTDNGRNTSLEKNGAGVMLSAFNNAIVRVALENGADFIDLYSAIGSTLYQSTYDRIHPTKDGMRLMSEAVLQKLRADFATE